VDGKYFAISNVCTHQGCEVDYIPSSKTYICPCHGSTYNANGGVIQGPATLPLARYEAKIEGGRLLVSLKPSN
jgi:cytochrome b6-f complex iron-sulfur subunit